MLPLAAITPKAAATQEAVAAAQNLYAAAVRRLDAAPDGSMCARCGCAAADHMTRRELMQRERQKAAADKTAAGAADRRTERVAAAKERARRAAAEGATLHETTADMVWSPLLD